METILTILILIFGFVAFLYTALYLYAIFVMSLGFIVYSKTKWRTEFSLLITELSKLYPISVKLYTILSILILINIYT